MKTKVILITGYKGGIGKSTIAENLAGKLKNSIILNLDFYQDAEDINSSETLNVGKNEDLKPIINNYSLNKDYVIIDAGGFDDKRIYEIKIDLFIFPLKSGYRSVKATIDSINTIYSKYSDNTDTMFVINEFTNDKEFDDTVELMNEIIEESDIDIEGEVKIVGVKYSKGLKTVENTKKSISTIRNIGGIVGYSFRNVDSNFLDLASEIELMIRKEGDSNERNND